jgi:hypothetical protein
MGRLLIIGGIILILSGFFIIYRDRIPFIGKLPGDILIEHNGFKLYFPMMTCIVISVLVSLVLVIIQFFKK